MTKLSIDAQISKNLGNKTALVTGASAGIGLATSELLASFGCRVLALARREDRLLELKKLNPLIEPIVADVTKLSELRTALGNRRVDILINNAGLARGRGGLEDSSIDDIDEVLEINLRALIQLTKFMLPQMIERGSGDIVNLGSIAGLFTYAGGSVYCATKFAVHALSQAWRQDLCGKDIRVIEICPGHVETEFSKVRFRGDESKMKPTYEGMIPLAPEDVAQSIVFALGQARHISLQNVVIMPSDQASVGQIYRGRTAGPKA